MPDASMRRSVPDVLARLPHSHLLSLQDPGPALRCILRGGDAAFIAAGKAFGVTLPTSPCRANSDGTRHALWLGPDERLLIAPAGDPSGLVATIAAAITREPHGLVDVSHRTDALILTGARVIDALNAGCPLDLDLPAFPVGMCTRTVLAKAEVILWRFEPRSFRLEAARSYIPYLAALLTEAAA